MTLDFNKEWVFSREDREPITVHLPHDAMLTEPRLANCHNAENTGFFPGGKYKYEKQFSISPSDIGKCISIEFEGIYHHATVLLNDEQVASHTYGYTGFTVDISGCVQAENTLTVLVDNSLEPNSRWYTGSGIYRPVFLRIEEKAHIEDLVVITKSYSPAVIEVTANAQGAEVMLYDGSYLIASGSLGEFHIPNAQLWSAETPKLYRCVVKTKTDEVEQLFGIRLIEWSVKTGLYINGEETLLRGGCVHHDNGILGACTFADSEERRVRILKQAGYNAIRASHNPCSRVLLEACDKLGMYVMDEAFDGWYTPKTYHDYARNFTENYKADIAAMVYKDVNHPSVIMYSIGNEVTESAQPRGITLAGEMTALIHSLDPSRPVTCGINAMLNLLTVKNFDIYKDTGDYKAEKLPPMTEGRKEKKSGSAFFNALKQRLNWLTDMLSGSRAAGKAIEPVAEKLDILGLNYGSRRYDKDIVAYPNRIVVGSETLFCDTYYNWERVKKHPAIIGDFVWTAWDYLGEAGLGDWAYPSLKGLPLTASCGSIDLVGTIGAQSYYQQVVWGLRGTPYIGVQPVNHAGETPLKGRWRFTDAIDNWNWQGCENQKTVVVVFSDAYVVRLSLNGKQIGTKKLKECKASFSVRYQQGVLKAVALDRSGKEVSHSMLKTGGMQRKLIVTPEKATLRANGQDLCFIPIVITDECGNCLPAEDVRVQVDVSGAGTLQGFGSAQSKTDEVFHNNCHNTYYGRALAVVRAGFIVGTVQVVVSANGFESQSFDIKVSNNEWIEVPK